jgi:hypothetical protein
MMPLYVFRTDDGEEVTKHFPLEGRPDHIVLADGRTARRIVSWDGGIRLRGKGWASKPERDIANRKRGPQ